MPITFSPARIFASPLKVGVLAGIAGGAAEVAWVIAYGTFAGAGVADVARGVTHAVLPAAAGTMVAVPLGILIHMALAAALGVALAIALKPLFARPRPALAGPAAVVAALVTVWAVNFFVVLPALDPSFLTLLPLAATFASKTLFAIAAAAVLARARNHDLQKPARRR
jgi:hypothetical protein